ncbi:MAG: hypothetical protein ACLFQX_08555 [Candidatus Kapaibacterium sp.]
MEEPLNEISLIIEKSKHAQTLPLTGVWGGPAPDRTNVAAYFYVESPNLPNVITVRADENGMFDPNKGEQISRGDYTREIQATFIMTPEVAVGVGKWLIDQGQMLIDARDGEF